MSDTTTTPAEQKVEDILTKVASKAKPPIVLSDFDKEQFFKAFLSDTQYQDNISIFDGKVNITFQVLTVADQDAIFSQVSEDQRNGINIESTSYINKTQFYRLVSSLISINKLPLVLDDSTDSILNKKVKALYKMPMPKVFLINRAFIKFEEKVEALSNAVQELNF